ncbi:MAG: EamA/RhaT family transporter [Deltaproteobacteria bacterium HGW-Deltaproteobacteria-15]|jgi:drug/metabolite transporter (DMT)-like permease|nr:MAG: EamA/RhaT family transporter [Deltaproteobacteria bacterium HGW-Deltaproteobacteria-15]
MEKSLAHGTRADLSPLAVATIIVLTLLWGFNYVTIKVSNEAISPVFASAVRSVIASICGILYCMRTRQKLFHKDVMLVHGMVVGLLFGLEFACIYFGLLYTDAARSVVFVYLSPFIVAVGAHFFLKGDRLTLQKVFGLVLAFGGMVTVFQGKPKGSGANMLFGDILQIMAAFLWAATTLYIKKFMATKIHPINTFLYQLVFSIPILFAVSLILEPQWISTFTLKAGVSLFYQSVIVAFASYFVWFKLIHDFPVSRLSSFTFFTPVFGVLFGVLFMGEELTVSLMVGLPLVCVGILFVNWKKEN